MEVNLISTNNCFCCGYSDIYQNIFFIIMLEFAVLSGRNQENISVIGDQLVEYPITSNADSISAQNEKS